MTPVISSPAPAKKATAGLFVLLALFSASGCAALIYEVVWYQLLQLAIGSTSVSLGILLATFMGGLCIGSLWLPHWRTNDHPLKLYAKLELGLAACAVVVQFAIPLLSRVYMTGAEHGLPGMLLRAILAAICMLPPTILMGASLPAIVRWVRASDDGVRWWGYLYGGNTAGAVLGCLLAGFYLLRVYNMATATMVGAAINVMVGLISLLLSSRMPAHASEDGAAEEQAAAAAQQSNLWPVYVSIALSGATALGAEVVWTRLLGMLLLGTVYVFAIILAVFLFGLAIGSAAGSRLLKVVKAQSALGWSQILLTLGIAWTARCIVRDIPYWTDDLLATPDPWHMYWLDVKRVIWAILPATLAWGASFPFACAAIAQARGARSDDSGRTAGGIYAANTLGGILGALAVSLVLIPWIGSQQSERVLLIASAASGLLVILPTVRGSLYGIAGVVAAIALPFLLVRSIDPIPGDLIAYGRFMAGNAGHSTILYTKEGRNSSVAISQWENGTTYVNVNGHVEATTEIYDMRLQRMVGHLPALLHANAKSVLGIGFGAGVSAGTFTRYPNIEKITVCEIEPVIPPASTKYFGKEDYQVALNPKTHIVFDDARHYLMTTTEKYDIIASDPLDVFIKGTAALYSKEYFEAVKSHLNPGGYFTLYVPLYETDEPTIKSELATFFNAFPNGTIWANLRDGLGYDMVFMGQVEPLKINLDQVQQRVSGADYLPVRDSLREIGIGNLFDLFSSYAGGAADLAPWVAGAQINTDGDLRLSYLAGWGVNSNLADSLYRQMIRYRKSPDQIFTGSPELRQALMSAF